MLMRTHRKRLILVVIFYQFIFLLLKISLYACLIKHFSSMLVTIEEYLMLLSLNKYIYKNVRNTIFLTLTLLLSEIHDGRTTLC